MKKNTKTDANSGSSSQDDNSLNEGVSNKMRKSRRRLIQVLVTGGAVMTAKSVPSKWSRPVVEAVMLPAHAQTSGELITLGNDGNFTVTSTQDLEPTESLLASGIEQGWAEIFDTLVEQANAADDTAVMCPFTGCSYIKYRSGDNSGQLYIGVFNYTEDVNGPTDLVFEFTDGQPESFSESCLPIGSGFLVELMSDNNTAKLTIQLDQKVSIPIELVKDFVCEPVEDGIVEDDS